MGQKHKISGFDIAFEEAQAAKNRGEVPIGAALFIQSVLVAKAGNRMKELNDPTAHAEMLVIKEACRKLKQERLCEADLYVTLEPCPMCASGISFARIRRLYYAVSDEKGGGIEQGARIFSQKSCNHKPEIYSGFREEEAINLMQVFFKNKRKS